MNRFHLATVYRFRTDPGIQRRTRSFQTLNKAAADDAADNVRSRHHVRTAFPGRPGPPPRPVGVKK